ncbi:MAG: right-handed parallel beta-helix repeat-containing protein [Sorangiineae bacterium]|nr:right-handed parallel beta-helix repeat-containing protein [Polyangiaceae bacterium]MEB2322893.1 right-handed parallel beta-helix repeat-containing protein [Sorangiineae bacterium]
MFRRFLPVLALALVLAACSDSASDPSAKDDDAGALDGGGGDAATAPDATASLDAGEPLDAAAADGGLPPGLRDPHLRFDRSRLGPKGLAPKVGCQATGAGRCRWVSPSGAGDTCTQAAPCRVKTVLASLVAGDVVRFLAGTYDASQGALDRISMDKYGVVPTTPQTPIVFEPEPGQRVIFRGDAKAPCVWIDGTGNLVFQGFEIEHCWEAGIRVGEDLQQATSNVTVRNSEFRDISCDDNMGAVFLTGVPGFTFENNVVHDFHKGSGRGLGMVIFRAKDLRVVSNEFYDLSEGIYYKHGERTAGDGGTTGFYGNYFHDMPNKALGVNQNRTDVAYNVFEDTGGLVLFEADGTVADFLFDVHVRSTTFIRSDLKAMQRGDGFSGAQNTTVDHSIFYDGKLEIWPYGVDADFTEGIGWTSSDNCFYSSKGPPVFDYFVSSNPAYGQTTLGGAYAFEEWKALGFDLSSTVADPELAPGTFVSQAAACAAYGAYGP